MQLGDYAAINSDTANGATNVSMNAYYNGTNWIYRFSSYPASYYSQINGQHRWYTAPSGTAGNTISFTQAMTLTAGGLLGIATTAPAATLGVAGNAIFSGSSPYIALSADQGGSTPGYIQYVTANATLDIVAAGVSSNGILRFMSGGTAERARITSGGDFCIGSSSPGNAGTLNLSVGNPGTTAGGLQLWSTTTGTHYVQFGDSASGGATYSGALGYSHTSDVMLFLTNQAERMRLDSSGNLGIGTTSPSSRLDVRSAIGTTVDGSQNINAVDTTAYAIGNGGGISFGYIFDSSGNVISRAAVIKGIKENSTSGNYATALTFSTTANSASTAERARIDSSGNLLVGTTSASSPATGFVLTPNFTEANAAGIGIAHQSGSASGDVYAYFWYNSNGIGSITQNGTTAVAYNTTSDYRLKDNQQPLTGSGAFIDALKPKTWKWKADGSKGVGFIAHEVQAVSPASVVGEKDAVDADGKPVYQAMEYGSADFIANIIAELQSLRTRVAQLEQGA
jgi:hypothetical protein